MRRLPLLLPIGAPDLDGYWLVIGVPPGEEAQSVALVAALPEVLRAQSGWPGCPAKSG